MGVWLTKEIGESDNGDGDDNPAPAIVDDEPIPNSTGGRNYKIVTRQYMAEGHDGFLPMKDKKFLIDDEVGKMMSTIARQYLMGMFGSALLANYR